MKVVVTGMGLVSALGTSLEASWQNLLAGKTGIRLHQPFPELGMIPLGLIAEQPSELSIITQMAVTSALKDAELPTPLPDCAVVIGSSRSYQAAWEGCARQELDLGNWLNYLPHMNAIAVARQIGTEGIVLAPMAACATGIWAIAQGMMLIKSGQCQQAIVGAVETPITPLTLSGFRQMGALAITGAYPFDRQREGLVLGEGAALFVLESAALAQQRRVKIYGEILGFGLTADAYHGNQPEPTGNRAIFAIKQCLQQSYLTPPDIGYIHAHGTATILNDQIESMVIQRLFPTKVPISSTKGSSGHTLGASGALGVGFTLMALQQEILPPCVGLQQPEFDLDFVITARESRSQPALCLSFGFGGQNAAIALAKYHIS